ncbi:MAG TPA: hypothetical protein VFK40_11115 [Nitrososphaeraceae archaeon]|nr:hypothetical protein [Nitrososphaeraceae archaeon]
MQSLLTIASSQVLTYHMKLTPTSFGHCMRSFITFGDTPKLSQQRSMT